MNENELSRIAIGAAIEVHKSLGPGLLESVYKQCLARELDLQDVPYQLELPINTRYKGIEFDIGYRIDMMISDKLVIELKVAEKILPVHEAQLLSYLRLSKRKLGLLLNFNVPVMKSGIRRIVNNL
ncbi:MAG: GxxExxY protein [Gammaproteobacteria bacterium]|nr:GxxExxY protein [Gammaproteobacteria bacterium]